MKIKCPQCSHTNELQNHCSNCGTKLLNEGVTFENNIDMAQEALPKKRSKWIAGIFLFLGIWIIGGVILDLFALHAGLNERYVTAITFFVGLVAMWWYVSEKSNEEVEETIN